MIRWAGEPQPSAGTEDFFLWVYAMELGSLYGVDMTGRVTDAPPESILPFRMIGDVEPDL